MHIILVCWILWISFNCLPHNHICNMIAVFYPGLQQIHHCWHSFSLLWRRNGRDGVWNHQPHDCLLNLHSAADQRKHPSSVSLAFVQGIHWWPVNSLYKWPVTRKMFPFDDVMHCNHPCLCLKQDHKMDFIWYINACKYNYNLVIMVSADVLLSDLAQCFFSKIFSCTWLWMHIISSANIILVAHSDPTRTIHT